METRKAYNQWASIYDTNINKTRDLEAKALRAELSTIDFSECLEIGCGTGKNTSWLAEKAQHVTAVDLSEEMLSTAKEKVKAANVSFRQADITESWSFTDRKYGLVSFSLVLEHIENLDHIFSEASKVLKDGGCVYMGELHPFKQYAGSKARFETDEGVTVLECFVHNISDFITAAEKHNLSLVRLSEYFDDENRNEIPRILTLVLKKE